MAEFVYLLCALMSIGCAFLLYRGYKKGRSQLLLWSCISFSLLALNNIVLVVDLVVLPDVNIYGMLWRNFLGAMAGGVLLYGLIWELT